MHWCILDESERVWFARVHRLEADPRWVGLVMEWDRQDIKDPTYEPEPDRFRFLELDESIEHQEPDLELDGELDRFRFLEIE